MAYLRTVQQQTEAELESLDRVELLIAIFLLFYCWHSQKRIQDAKARIIPNWEPRKWGVYLVHSITDILAWFEFVFFPADSFKLFSFLHTVQVLMHCGEGKGSTFTFFGLDPRMHGKPGSTHVSLDEEFCCAKGPKKELRKIVNCFKWTRNEKQFA